VTVRVVLCAVGATWQPRQPLATPTPVSKTPCRFVTNDTAIAGSVGGEVRRLGEAAVDEVEPWVRTGTFRTPVHPETLASTA
jgi:hypothetical protein